MPSFKMDRLHVSVETDRIALVKTGGLFRPRIAAERLLPAALDPEKPQSGLEPLAAELASGEWKNATVHVVLSDQLVRYFVFDIVPGIRGLRELKQLMAAQFEDLCGLPAADWEIRADLAPFAPRLLACAMDRRLLAALLRLFSGPEHALASVQPFMVREFNRRCRRLRSDPAWFAAAERHSLTLALLSRKTWQGLRTHSLGKDSSATLPTLLAREQVVHGEAGSPSRVCLTGSATADGAMAADGPLPVIRLDSPGWPGRSAAWCRDYRLALAGIWP